MLAGLARAALRALWMIGTVKQATRLLRELARPLLRLMPRRRGG